ncbi:MAG: hypothetical protein V7637_2427 [Mycobacteriales bacterium]|jgi:uncharacterized protein
MSRARLDPRGPLVLDVRELGRRPGSMQPVRREVPAPDGLAVELARVPAGATVTLDLRMESVVEGVLVSGTITAPVAGECGRCLDPVDDELTVDVQELFAYPDSATDDTADAEEVRRLAGDLLDLEPMLRDAVVLALPLSPLCSADCRGLCSGCGVRWDDLPADHSHETLDPRWAALTERFSTGSTDSQES